MYLYVHMQKYVFVPVVKVTDSRIISAEGPSLAARSRHGPDCKTGSVTGADDFMGRDSISWHWTVAKEAATSSSVILVPLYSVKC